MASCLQTLEDEGSIKPSCVVCCHPCQIVCYGSCDHLVCHRCMTKLRILCQDQHCPVCRSSLEKVVFADTFQSFDQLDISSMHQCNSLQGLYFSTSENMYQCQQLLIHQCKLCVAKPTFKSFNLLRDHLKDVHKRYFCNLCVEHLKLFTNERRLYSKPALHIHIKSGDDDDKSYKGHPICKFCKKHYFDDDDLYLHLHHDHFSCQFCPANHYYSTYESLRQHFKDNHYLCEIDECIDEKFVNAFSTDIDYKAHLAQKHKHLLNRAEERKIRHVDIDLTYSRTNNYRTAGKNRSNDTNQRSEMISGSDERNEMEDRMDALAITGDYEDEFPSLANNVTKSSSFLSGYSSADKNYTGKERRKDRHFNQSVPQHNFQQQKVYQKVAGMGKSLTSDEDFPSLTPSSVPTDGTRLGRQTASQSNWKSISHDRKFASKKNQNSNFKVKKNLPQKIDKSMEDFPSLPTKNATKIPNFVDDFSSDQNSTKSLWEKSATSNSASQFSNNPNKFNQKEATNTIKAAETFSNSKNKSKGKAKKKSNYSLKNNDNDNYKYHREENSSEIEKNERNNTVLNSAFNASVPLGSHFNEDFPVLSSNPRPSDSFNPDQSYKELEELKSFHTNFMTNKANEVNTGAAKLYSKSTLTNQKESTNTIKATETFSNSKNKSKGKAKKKSNFSLKNNDNDNYKYHREENSSEIEKNERNNTVLNSAFNASVPLGSHFNEDFPVLSSNPRPSDSFNPDQSYKELEELKSFHTNFMTNMANEVNTGVAKLYSESTSTNFAAEDFPALPVKEKPTYAWLDDKNDKEVSDSQWKTPSNDKSNFNTNVTFTEQQLSTKGSVLLPPGFNAISSHQNDGLNVGLTGDNILFNNLLMKSNNQDNSNNMKNNMKPPPGLSINKVATVTTNASVNVGQTNISYTPPTDADKRQTKLISLISNYLKSTEKLNNFKKLSTDYRKKRVSASKFYTDCLDLFGDYFYQILPEMVVLIPDIERQNDFFKIWCDSIDQIKSRRKDWRAIKDESNTDIETICTCLPCPSCGQIVLENDFDQHTTYHSNIVTG